MFAVLWLTDNSNPNLTNWKRSIGGTGFPAIVSDELRCTADSWEHNSKHIVDSCNLESLLSGKALYTAANYRWEQDNNKSHSPNKTIVPLDIPQRRIIWKALKVSIYSHLSISGFAFHHLIGYPLLSLSWTHHSL